MDYAAHAAAQKAAYLGREPSGGVPRGMDAPIGADGVDSPPPVPVVFGDAATVTDPPVPRGLPRGLAAAAAPRVTVVSLSPGATETVVALGMAGALVGVAGGGVDLGPGV